MPDISLEDWARRLSAEGGETMRRVLTTQLRALALDSEARAKRNATTRLRVRTGRLRSSIHGDVAVVGDTLAVRLSAGLRRELPYARAQEEGGSISPRRGRYLAIPLPPALTAAGVLRSRFVRPGGLRAVPSLFAIRRPGKRTLLAEKRGDTLQPMFVLHEGPIRIKGKHYLRDALETVRQGLPEALREAVSVAVLP